ncbi:MCP four helix bundle domain-containing protein [Desertivirga xinjiangensis]|uniref:MCP four helix bundle domain-containing protein n=1 Tax=Desertivirga xinjiangensis TaxID=539206 RepID=UPI00210A885B|nr:MCP four helix bundle domain-containing protein [Pedobacter xinjiangensis]
MKWTFVIQQKLKVASLLAGVMLMVVLFNLIERKNIAEMNRSVTSIYNDRLVPATGIFYLTDNLYSKRFLLEKFLSSGSQDIKALRLSLAVHDQNIKLLINQFEKTYMVDKELTFLNEFKQKVTSYTRIEEQILLLAENHSKREALALYDTQGKSSLISTVQKLSELTKIQTTVGGELLNNTKRILATSDLLSHLQMALAIGIGLVIVSLITASKAVTHTEKNFHLN